MQFTSTDQITWGPAPAEYFTGRAWFGPMADPGNQSEIVLLGVGFEPSARTAWHSHPGGQVLYVVSGNGLVGNEAGERTAIRAGDTVRVPPGELHWHGAEVDSPLFHLSITVGEATAWTDRRVTDDEYRGT